MKQSIYIYFNYLFPAITSFPYRVDAKRDNFAARTSNFLYPEHGL